MLFLIAGFIALMVQVEVQQEMDSAVGLAASSAFQAQRGAPNDNIGPSTPCRFINDTFTNTMSFYNKHTGFMTFQTGSLCSGDRLTLPSGWVEPSNATITCKSDYFARRLGNELNTGIPITCTAKATLDFKDTPLAWAVLWSPTISSSETIQAPALRQ